MQSPEDRLGTHSMKHYRHTFRLHHANPGCINAKHVGDIMSGTVGNNLTAGHIRMNMQKGG